MSTVTDFTRYSQQRIVIDGNVVERVMFTFTVPFIQNPHSIQDTVTYLAGYQLFRDNVLVQQELISSISTSTGVSSLTGFITFDFDDRPGEWMYFKIRLVDKGSTIYLDSNVIVIESSPHAVQSIHINYFKDGHADVYWEEYPSTKNYFLYQGEMEEYKLGDSTSIINDISLEEGQFTISFTQKISGYFRVVYSRWEWVIQLFDSDFVILSNATLENFCDIDLDYEQISIINIRLYYTESLFQIRELSTSTGVTSSTGYVTSTGYMDSFSLDLDDDLRYVFSILPKANVVTNPFFEKYTDVSTILRMPDILRLGIQTDSYLKSDYWKQIKNVLVDSHYYDKSYYAIPYKEDGYSVRGYVGIGQEYIDVFVNGRLTETIISTSTGYFDFNFPIVLGANRLRLTTSTPQTAPRSSVYEISTYRIYSHFAAIGAQIESANDSLTQVRNNFFLSTVDADNIRPNFSSQVGLLFSQSIDVTLENFREIVTAVLHAHLDFGLRVSLITLTDGFKRFYTDYFIHEKHSQLIPFAPRSTEIVGSPNLFRGKYYYGVSAVNSIGAETDVTIITLDKRWWPFFFISGIGLEWDRVVGAENYRIYRGQTEDSLKMLVETSAGLTRFIDNGYVFTSTGKEPYTFNFTDVPSVSSVEEIKMNINMDNFFTVQRKTQLTVIITSEEDPFPDLVLTRLWTYLSLAITPLKLRLIIAGDRYILLKDYDAETLLFQVASDVIDSAYVETITPDKWSPLLGYYVYDMEHNLESYNILPRAYEQILTSTGYQGVSVIPGFRRLSENVLRIYWNNPISTLQIDIIRTIADGDSN